MPWQVRWRQSDAEVSESFLTEAGAIKFRGLVDAAASGIRKAGRPVVASSRRNQRGPDVGPVWFQLAVDSRPGANNRTRSDYRRDFVTHVPEGLACKPIETISREEVGKWLTELQTSLAKDDPQHPGHG